MNEQHDRYRLKENAERRAHDERNAGHENKNRRQDPVVKKDHEKNERELNEQKIDEQQTQDAEANEAAEAATKKKNREQKDRPQSADKLWDLKTQWCRFHWGKRLCERESMRFYS